MVNMEETNLIILFPKNEEYRIQELYELGEVVPPQSLCYLQQQHKLLTYNAIIWN